MIDFKEKTLGKIFTVVWPQEKRDSRALFPTTSNVNEEGSIAKNEEGPGSRRGDDATRSGVLWVKSTGLAGGDLGVLGLLGNC